MVSASEALHEIVLPASVAALYPFSPARVKTPDGATMSYVDEGPRTDSAVLMLHGNPTWSFFYRDLVRGLSPTQRCVVPDHIGMGLSEKPENYSYRLETRIRDVESLVKHLGLRRVRLVVHDWGGAIGFGFATRHPEMIERIVILNTAAFFLDRIPFRIAVCRAGFFGKWLVRGLNGFARPATRMTMHQRTLTAAEKAGYLLPYDSWAHRVAVHAFVEDIPMEGSHPSRVTLAAVEAGLPSLGTVPKLVVWGARDFCFDDAFLQRWKRICPEARVVRHANAGHYVLDDAGPAAREEIISFLNTP